MKRIEAISAAASAARAAGALIVCNIGYPSRELFHAADSEGNFYMLGSMGLCSSIALGLALSESRRPVIALDGDGSVLMNLGTLATIANHAPPNLVLVILDNCAYGSTGCQLTCTASRSDLAAISMGAGVGSVHKAGTTAELQFGLSRALEVAGKACVGLAATSGHGLTCGFAGIDAAMGCVIVAKVEPGNASVPIIDLSPQEILDRFMRSVQAYR
jgi:sulfopyruvate decarboxylase subunit beta